MKAKKAFKFLAWFVGGLLSLLLVLVLLVGGTAYWAYHHPQEAFQLAEKHFLPKDLKITWDDLTFDVDSLGGLNARIDIRAKNLRAAKSPEAITNPSATVLAFDVPLDEALLTASIYPFERRAVVHAAEAFAANPLRVRTALDTDPAPAKNPIQKVQDIIQLLKLIHERFPIETFEAGAKRLELHSPGSETFNLTAAVQQELNQPLSVEAAFWLPGEAQMYFQVEGDVDLKKIETDADFLNAELKFNGFNADADLAVQLRTKNDVAHIQIDGPVKYSKEKLRLVFDANLGGTFSKAEAKLKLVSDVKGIPGPMVSLQKVKLDLTTPLEDGITWSSKPSAFSLNVPIELFFVKKAQRPAMEKACGCNLPEVILAKADGKVWLQALMGQTKEVRQLIDTKIVLDSLTNETFSVDLAADLKIERENEVYRFSPQLNSSLAVHSFQRLKPLLDINGVLIPAPFDILEGTLNFSAVGPVATSDKGLEFPLALNVDLASATQKVKLDTTAAVLLNPNFTNAHFDIKAKIANLYLDLPPLDPLGGMPRVARDSRFLKTPPNAKPKASKFKVSFNFALETLSAAAIRLKSKYFKPYLPLQINVQSTGGTENTGFIASEPFDVTYMRRTVRVEALRIDLDGNDKGIFPLRGRISVKQTQYTVFIDVAGTTKSPSVTLSSEPYLPKDDIISVLLFDRVSDQLVAGDAETKGGVQAAIADRAIGLFGLWAFATTPIKSFSYNPVTKVYSATVAVSDDLTAGVGTDWEAAARLELRKRISRSWSLTAAWTPATQEEDANSKLVLQWEKRF